MNLLLSWLLLAAAFYLASVLIPGVRVASFGSAMVVSAVFAVLQVLLGWLLLGLLGLGTLGIAWLLPGLTWLVIGALLIKLTAGLTDRLAVDGFGSAFLAALLMAVVQAVGDRVLGLH